LPGAETKYLGRLFPKPEFTTVEERQQRTIDEVLNAIPDEHYYAKYNQQFRGAVSAVMLNGFDAVDDDMRERIKAGIKRGILPADLEYKAWEKAYPDASSRLYLQQAKYTALQSGQQIAGNIIVSMMEDPKYDEAIDTLFGVSEQPDAVSGQGEPEAGVEPELDDDGVIAKFFQVMRHPEKSLAEFTDELIEFQNQGQDRESFINFGTTAGLNKFMDASIADKFRYMMGTVAGSLDSFMDNVIGFLGKLPYELTPEATQETKDQPQTEGAKTHRLVRLVEGLATPFHDWATYLGLNPQSPIGSAGWQQSLEAIMGDPITHTAILMAPIKGMRMKYRAALERPPVPSELPPEVTDYAKAQNEVLRRDYLLDEARLKGETRTIEEAEAALAEAKVQEIDFGAKYQELKKEIAPPVEPGKAGLEQSWEINSALAHEKNKVIVAEQALAMAREKGADVSVISEFERDVAQKQAKVDELQKEFDRVRDEMVEQTDLSEIPPEQPPPETPADVGGQVSGVPPLTIGRVRNVGPSAYIRTPSNLFGAIPGQKARYGFMAQEAQTNINMTEMHIIMDAGMRGRQIEDALSRVDRKDWGKKGEKFYDDYEKIVNPELTTPDVAPSTVEAANILHRILEDYRARAIEVMREDHLPSVQKIVELEYRLKNDLKGKKLTDEQRLEIKGQVEKRLDEVVDPAWGLDYYLPQMHPGWYNLYIDIDGAGMYVGSARNIHQAKLLSNKDYAARLEAGEAFNIDRYDIKGRAFRGADILRTTDKRFFSAVQQIADAAEIAKDQAVKGLRGTLGRKAGRKKFAGFMQERAVAGEYFSKDVTKVLASYVQTFTRWERLTPLNREVVPLIEKIRAEGGDKTAKMLEETLSYLWGESGSKLSGAFDAFLAKMPGVRDYVYPQALERWANTLIKTPITVLFLKASPRFHALNITQTGSTLWPQVSSKEFIAGQRFYQTAAGRAAIDKYGVRYLTGGKISEGGRAWTSPEFREKFRFAPETFNQEVAWATMFKRARDMGMDEAAANDYALLKGVLHTQFCFLRSDTPPLLRGPITSTVFMFRRFQIKNLEMGYDLIASRNFPGAAKWFGAQFLLGGTKALSRGIPIGATLSVTGVVDKLPYLNAEMYEKIKKEYGEYAADGITYGLPGLIGLDPFYSIQLFDTPWGQSFAEKTGNLMIGPPGQTATSLLTAAADTKGIEGSAWRRTFYALSQRVPSLRWIDALRAWGEKLDNGEYMFRDAAGRGRFKADMKDLIVRALGGRTTEEGEIDLLIEAVTWVVDERDQVMDRIVHHIFADQTEAAVKLQLEWDEKWGGEFGIGFDGLKSRYAKRMEERDMDRFERYMQNAPKVFKASELYINRMMEQYGGEKPESASDSLLENVEALKRHFGKGEPTSEDEK
jgi:hypothetical protein